MKSLRIITLLAFVMLAFAISASAQITVAGSTGADGSYATLSAAFTAINGGVHTGNAITIAVTGDTAEPAAGAILNAGVWTSITISPSGGAARTITGAATAGVPLVDFNGADNVTIDGLNTGGNSLTISNNQPSTTAGTSTIRYINDATSNTIQNATVNGNALGAATGTIFFSNTIGTTGNDNNTVTACNIGPVAATFPANGILSSGITTTQATRNSGIQITNNNIFDFFTNTAVIANGVLASAGTTDITITGNSFYQTATRTMTIATSGFIGISIADTSSINNTISNNFIGGNTASAGGTAWTQTGAVTHTFIGIRMSVGTATPSSLQNNVIRNLSISTSTTSTINAGISAVTGAMNIGTTTGNTIGATTGTGSITWTGAGSGARFAAISSGTGTPGGINISNNNVGSVTIAGAGTTVFYGIRMEGAATAAYTVSGNTIGSTTTANSITNGTNNILVGISGTHTGFPASVTNNTIQNLQHTSTGTTASLRGIDLTGSVSGQNIANNTIANFSSASTNTSTTTAATVSGIVLTGSATSGNTITANTIRDLASTTSGATAVYANGITITSTPGTTMSRNFIYNLTTASTSATSSIQGIYLFNSSATENIYNNMIRLGTGVGNNPIIRGIRDNTATSSPTNIIHNSIFIDGTQGAATVNTNCIVRDLASTMTITDNILWNNRASTGVPGAQTGRHYTIQNTATTGTFTSNYNDLYAPNNGGAIGQSSSLDRITITDWRTATSQDVNSQNADPQFIDATNATTPNLHIHPTNVTLIEGNGILVSPPTDDFDGQTRASFTPVDIGADAGNFVGLDLTAPSISYTTLTNTTSTANRAFTGVTITDAGSGVNTTAGTKPRAYYKRLTDGNVFNDNTSGTDGWKFVEANGATSPFDFTIDYSLLNGGGGVATGQTVQYFVVAQDLAGTPNVGINSGSFALAPSSVALTAAAFPIGGTINSYAISTAYTGSYSVPGAFPSLTNTGGIFEAINAGVVTGNITINITSDLAGELGTFALNQWTEEGVGGYTMLIKPSGAPRMISGTNVSGLIKLNGADRVRIDGSTAASFADNIVGGNPALRELNISNTGVGAIIWIATNATSGANSNTIQNINMSGPGGFAGQGILAGSGTTFGAAAESGRPNSNNTVNNNSCKGVQNCVFASGDATTRDLNWLITQNDFGSAMVAEKLSFRGIFVSGAQTFTISENRIRGISSATGTSATMSGIMLSGAISTGAIVRNEIKDIRQNNTVGWGSNGIYLASTSTATSVMVANNFVSDIASQGFAGNEPTDNGYGIVVEGLGGGYTVAHNTVVMNTNQVAAGSITAALLIDESAITVGAVNLQDNILANTQTVGTQYSVYVDTPVTSAVFPTINFNDYYSVENVGILGGVVRISVGDWMTATTQDAMSQNIDPMFVSATDFHLNAMTTPLLGDGTMIAGVTNDFDNDPRPASNPEIGADEIVQAVGGVVPAGTFYNASMGSGSTDTLAGNVTITNSLTLAGGETNTGANTLTLGCNATVSGAGGSNYVIGNFRKEFCATGAFTFPVGTASDAMLLGAPPEYTPFTANVTAIATIPSSLTVTVVDNFFPNGMSAPQSASRYWDVTEAGDLTADISFTYLDGDINGTETGYNVLRRAGGLTNTYPGGTVTAATNTATAPGVMNFSQWGAGNLAPLAAGVNVGGRVVRADGQGIPNTRVVLTDSSGNSRITRTSSFGYYNFENVDSGQTVTVTAANKRYVFANPTLVINVGENVTDADFVASGENDLLNPNETYFDRAPFDFDGDGRTDISVFRAAKSTWMINRSSDNKSTKQAFGLPTDVLAPADFDGDGITDYAVFRASEGTWYIWNSATNDLQVRRHGADGDVPVPADADGDMKADLIVWNTSKNTWSVLQSSDGRTVEIAVENTDKTSVPLLADYDTDGKADLTIFVKSSGTWRIVLSSTGETVAIKFGDRRGSAMMGDFDGDSRADLAIYSEGVWTIRNSRTGEISTIEHGGTASAVVGDYDGDNRLDASVYQTGRWTLRQSASGFIKVRDFGANGDVAVPSIFVR